MTNAYSQMAELCPRLSRAAKLLDIVSKYRQDGKPVLAQAMSEKAQSHITENLAHIIYELEKMGMSLECSFVDGGETKKFFICSSPKEAELTYKKERVPTFLIEEIQLLDSNFDHFAEMYAVKSQIRGQVVENPDDEAIKAKEIPPEEPRPESAIRPRKHTATAIKELARVKIEVVNCSKCELSKTRTLAVPGTGHSGARVMFVGEAPGASEDAKGQPFVGLSGKLLDELLGSAGMSRQEFFITNIVKCRPPDNRDPLPNEIQHCSSYLFSQIDAINPDLIVTLGKPALLWFDAKAGSISKKRGRAFKWRYGQREYMVFPTYHPASTFRKNSFSANLRMDIMQIPHMVKSIEQQTISGCR